MSRTVHALMALSVAVAFMSTPSRGAPAGCGAPQTIAEALARGYREAPLATALLPDGRLMTLFVSATGSWTITAQRPDGSSCIVAAGEDFSLLHRDGLVPDGQT